MLTALISIQCGSSKTTMVYHGHYRQQLMHADSLFRTDNFELAKVEYTKIRDNCDIQIIASSAQYRLGYLNIYYDNPFADYEAALREFTLFQSLYPNDDKIDLVRNWIRILTVLQSFARDYNSSSQQMEKIDERRKNIFNDYKTLQDAYLSCDATRDSLKNEIKVLQGLIDKLISMDKK